MNPYDPPVPAPSGVEDTVSDSVGSITSQFIFTSDHLIDTLARYRTQHKGRRIWRWFRYIAAFIFLLFAFGSLFVPLYFMTALMVGLTIFMFFPHKIDDLIAQRRFRSSPECNAQQVIHLSDDGFQAKSQVEETNLKWAAFSKAVAFHDGVLLFRGSNMVHWIPDATLDRDGDPVRIRALVAAKLPTNRVIQRNTA